MTVKVTSNITLGADVAGDDAQAYINGKITVIHSDIIQKLTATANSVTGAAGSKTEAFADINSMDNEQIIDLYNVFLGGIDTLTVKTETSEMDNAASASASIEGATGAAVARSNVRINSSDSGDAVVGKIYVSENADLAGQSITIIASAPNVHSSSIVESTAKARSDTATKWIVKIFTFGLADDGSEDAVSSATLKVISNVILNGTFHIGGGAAGSFVDIDENGNIH